MSETILAQVTVKLEEDFHQRGIQIGADGSVFVVHPGDAWGISATRMGYKPLRGLYGVDAIQAIGLFGAVYALGHHQHKTRRGDSSGATLATQVSNEAQRVA